MIGSHCCTEQTDDAGRDGDHQDLRNRNLITVGIGDRDESHDRSCNRGTGYSNLGCYGCHGARPFGTDVLLDGYIHDDWHQGIDHMAGTYQHGKEEGTQRGEDGDTLRMLPEKFFGKLDQPVHSAGSLKDSRTGDGCDNDIDNIRGRSTRLHSESEYEDGQADA